MNVPLANVTVDATLEKFRIDLPFDKAYPLVRDELLKHGWTIKDPPHDENASVAKYEALPEIGPPSWIAEFDKARGDSYVLSSFHDPRQSGTELTRFVSVKRIWK